MWYFQSAVNEDRKFLLLPGKEYVIGRRDCDIVIENDQAVSRKHAILSVAHSEANVANVNKPATLTLKDVSTFGTRVNNHKIKEKQILQDGDEVVFGTARSLHRVVYEPFVITTSCLDGAGKKEARSLVYQMGGHISSDWRGDCSYLVMKTITVTVKVVSALLSLKPIVTVRFLQDLLSFYKGRMKVKPQPENYLPPVTDQLIEPGVSFQVNMKRSSVFLGMSFYFLSERQFQKMNAVVVLGGGVPLLHDSPEGADLESFVEGNAVVMNPAPSDLANPKQSEWVDKVSHFLSKKGKFMVQDAEIGYAALYASTDMYCNADKDVFHLLPGVVQSQSLPQASSLSSQSQVVPTQMESSQRQSTFRKPPAPAPAKQTPHRDAHSHSHSSDKPAPKPDLSQKARGKLPEVKISQEEYSEQEQKVFTVPESLTEESVSVKVKRERPTEADNVPTFDASLSVSGSQRLGSKKTVTVKEEDESFSGQQRQGSSVQPSDTLPDIEMSAVKEEDRTDRKPILFLDDEDDDIVQTRKPPPSKNKRRLQNLSDDEDDPFDFVKKRKMTPASSKISSEPELQEAASLTSKKKQRAADSASKSQRSTVLEDPIELIEDSMDEDNVSPFDFDVSRGRKLPSGRKKQRSRSPSPAPASRKEKVTRRSPSPNSKPKAGRASRKEEDEDFDLDLSSSSVSGRATRRSPSPKPRPSHPEPSSTRADDADVSETSSGSAHRQVTHTERVATVSSAPVPDGFLTTRQPIEDQIPVNPHFEKENIDAPAMVIQFEDLVHRQTRRQPAGETDGDQSDVPQGMMRWKGKIVPNFKKFRKTKHAGADRLPRIIGGRDLEEHCRSTNKIMEDWLKDLTEVESQQQERDREAQRLFDFQPTVRGRKSRR